MNNFDMYQPGPSRSSYNNYLYSNPDHFQRNFNDDQFRGSIRGARQPYNTSMSHYSPPMYHHVNQLPSHNVQQKEKKRDQNVNKDKTFRKKNKNEGIPSTSYQTTNNQPNNNHTSKKSTDNLNHLYKCPHCSLRYDCIVRNNMFVGKVPLILKCKHTVCQDCIPKMAIDTSVLCPICKKASDLPSKYSAQDLQEIFPPNFYLIGIITCYKTHGTDPTAVSLVPVQVTRRSRSPVATTSEQQTTGIVCCFLSCNKEATVFCKDCNDNYCAGCFTVVHKSAKSLWSHQHVPLEISSKKAALELEHCHEHNMDIELNCTTCETLVCCYCFIDKHEGHKKENLTKLDDLEMEEFKSYKEKAKNILKQLLVTQKKLQDVRSCNTTNIQKKVSSYFVNLHARLQYLEKNLLKEISNYESTGIPLTQVSDLNVTIETSINELKYLTASCEAISVRKMNMKEIANNLKKVQNIPCYLISNSTKPIEPLTFDVPSVIDNLEEMFAVRKAEYDNFKLVREEDLPPDYVKESLGDTDAESEISSVGRITLDDGKVARPAQRHAATGNQVALDNEMVEVTHIESLDCFYVQLKKIQYQLSQMNSDINNYIKFGAPMAEHPQLNELYLVQYQNSFKKVWCRGRVTEIKNGEMEPLYEVFFIDYGSVQTVDVSKIRQITPDIARKKAFAIHCSLYNPSMASWTKNAHVYMGKMLNGKLVSMLVKSVHRGIHEVDLMVMSSDRGQTSIIDILIHTCSNALSDDSSSVKSYNRGYKIFANSSKFKKYQQEKVFIVNVIDPHHIFIHLASYADSLKKMNFALKQKYRNSKKNNSCLPIEGTHVIVEYKDNLRGNWHRGLIKKVDITTEKCHVLLLDWGMNVTVDWTNVRMLQEEFTKLESQAILVKLAHIEPLDKGTAWTNAATVFLQKFCRSQETMKMIVNDTDPLAVALFECFGDLDICINTQLVLEGYAISTGKISETLEWPQNDAEIKGFSEDDGLVAALLKQVDESTEDSEEDVTDTNVVKQKIEVIKCIDPSLIYIKFSSNEQLELDLNKELQIHYSKERKTKTNWEVNEFCVVLYNFSYARGKIIEKISDKKYKVNVYDRATEVEVSLNKIYEIAKYFCRIPNVVFKAHLANIRPAGGDKWSLSSIEALERLFDKHKEIFGTKIEGDTRGKSIPMQMWYTHVKMGGALEASKTKFVSLNHMLVKLGFAYNLINAKTSQNETDSASGSSASGDKFPLLAAIEKTIHNCSSSDVCSDQEPAAPEDKKLDDVPDSSSTSQEDTPVKREDCVTDWNELVEEEEKMKKRNTEEEAEINDWIPAFPIKETEFYAWITCAETNGILYLREEKLQNVYKEMEQNIKEYFDKEPPFVPENDWKPGQLCTIFYEDYYYRGKVYKVEGPDDITAVMIDFGSDHKLTTKNLIRKILYPKIPAFASKIKLYKIYPKSGSWLDSDYQTLLDVVSEYSKIIVKSSLQEEIPEAEVFTDKGTNINQYLVQTCPNLLRTKPRLTKLSEDDHVVIEEEEDAAIVEEDAAIVEEDAAIVEEEAVDINEKKERVVEEDKAAVEEETGSTVDTTKFAYKISPLPKEVDKKIAVSIMFVLEYNKLALKETATLTDEFFELGDKIQKTVKYQPVIEKLELGMPCVCQFSEDMMWYRAQIYSLEGLDCGYVFVFFVDFGNVESVPVTDIKMMRPEWFNLSVSCHIVEVNIELVSDKNIQHVTQYMKKLYGKNKLAEVVSEDPLRINLFDLDGELAYKFLLDKSLIKTK